MIVVFLARTVCYLEKVTSPRKVAFYACQLLDAVRWNVVGGDEMRGVEMR